MAEQYTRDELNKLSRQALIELLLSLLKWMRNSVSFSSVWILQT